VLLERLDDLSGMNSAKIPLVRAGMGRRYPTGSNWRNKGKIQAK